MKIDSGGARQSVLEAIRARLAESAPHNSQHHPHAAIPAARDRNTRIPAAPIKLGDKTERIAFFAGRLKEIGARLARVKDDAGIAAEIDRIIAETSARRVAVSDSPRLRGLPELIRSSVEWVPATVPAAQLADCDLGISTVQWGIAETGTLVLDSNRERNRLISLIPPVHIAVIEESQVLPGLADAIAAIRGKETEDLSPAVTLITGPSRTADIELKLTVGVHGPRELHVILLGSGE